MNKEIKEQWIADLRSGKFKQAKGALKNEEGYCCYGVLAERAVEAGVLVRNQNEDGSYTYAAANNSRDRYDGVLPYAAWLGWAELEDQNPLVCPDDSCLSLTEMNDYGDPFSVIADLIEKYL